MPGIESAAADRRNPLWGGLEGRSPPNAIRTRRHARRVRKPCAAKFSRIDKWNTLLRGCRKGRPAPSCAIRSGGMYAARSGCKPLPLSCSGRALRAQEHDVPFAARLRNSLAAKDRRKRPAQPAFQLVEKGRRSRPFSPGHVSPAPWGAAGETCRETLLRKASEPAAHVAGFGWQLEGFGPPNLPKGFFDGPKGRRSRPFSTS